MRSLYWQPKSVTRVQRIVIAVLAVIGLVAVERFPTEKRQPYYELKIRAAQKAQEAMGVIREVAMKKRLVAKFELDPTQSGLIGAVISPITSGSGSLISKQTTVNPNLAAVAVEWLKKCDVKPGDLVAIGVSGSFPSINIAVYSAIHEIGAQPLIVTSVAASQFGANNPSLTWLDMETALREQDVFPYKSLVASLGGVGDDAIGISERGRRLLDRAIERNEVPQMDTSVQQDEAGQRAQLIQETIGTADAGPTDDNGTASVVESQKRVDESGVARRMRVYRQAAGDRNIKAFVNVGGGTVAVGTRVGKKSFRAGVNRRQPKALGDIPSVMGEFIKADVPAIHFTRIVPIAQDFGLPIAPVTPPEVGEGGVFQRRSPNRLLAGLGFLAILIALLLAGRPPWMTRIAGAYLPPQRPKQG